jgi:predicted GTPase
MHTIIKRKAVGRSASLGSLYDCRTDQFIEASLVIADKLYSITESIDIDYTKFEYIPSDSLTEDFKLLGIDEQLKASVLCGILNVNGSSKYLESEKKSFKSVKSNILYEIQTKKESLKDLETNLKDSILNASNHKEATHVVVGIKWGSSVIASFEYPNKENNSKIEIQEKIRAVYDKRKKASERRLDVNMTQTEIDFENKLDIKIFADVITNNLSQSFVDVLEIMKNVPKDIECQNGGKGKQVEYSLYPLNKTEFKELSLNTLINIENVFETMLEAKQKLKDFCDYVKENERYASDYELNKIESKKKDFKKYESTFRSEVATTIKNVRSCKDEEHVLIDLLETFNRKRCSKTQLNEFLKEFKEFELRLKNVKICENLQIIYLKNNEQHHNVIDYNCDVFIFFTNLEFQLKDPVKFTKYFNFLIMKKENEKKNKDEIKFYVYDYDLSFDKTRNRELKISKYEKSVLIYEDVFENQQNQSDITIFEDEDDNKQKSIIKASKVEENQVRHISQKKSEINILLLGQTGVGKSTFINSFINYLNFDTLHDAIDAPGLLSVIPSSFAMVDENRVRVNVIISSDANEELKTGQSSTQFPKAHVFDIDERLKLRIIDTPGLGDVRGIEEDKNNFKNILSYISNYENINAICILLKPNEARLELGFRYVIKELLTQLHKDEIKNIIFCFTNTRGTFYEPGETWDTLKELLSEVKQTSGKQIPLTNDNVFCFDNEPFKLLAALKQGVQFTIQVMRDYESSWNRSSETLKKMVTYILDLQVHDVCQTLSLNDARQMIISLAKPLAEITRNIEKNIKICEDRVNELASGDLSIAELKKKLCVPAVDLERFDLGHPRTVCTSSECVEVVNQAVVYITHCHEKCYLKGVAAETRNNADLINCSAMTNGKCNKCSHSAEEHMHMTYDVKQIPKMVNDSNVEVQIKTKEQQQSQINRFINENEKKIKEYIDEKSTLSNVCAKLSRFVQQNAIYVVNDDIDRYLQHLIKEEEKVNAGGKNHIILQRLRDSRRYYKMQQNILSANIANGSTEEVKIDKIPILVQSLYNLKHSGHSLRKIFDN